MEVSTAKTHQRVKAVNPKIKSMLYWKVDYSSMVNGQTLGRTLHHSNTTKLYHGIFRNCLVYLTGYSYM